MDYTKAWIGVISEISADDRVNVDIAAFVRKLLLFDVLIIHSTRLREFGPLVDAFGYDGVVALLRSGALRIHCHALTVGQVGQTDLEMRAAKGGLLPFYSYSFAGVKEAYRAQYLSECMQNLDRIDGLTIGQTRALKRFVSGQLITPATSVEKDMISQLLVDLETNAPVVKAAVTGEVHRRLHVSLRKEFLLSLHRIDNEDFRVETDLHRQLNVPPSEGHRVVETALLGVGGLNQRIAEMKAYRALPNFSYRDLPLLGERFAALSDQLAPERRDLQLAKVLSLPGLPVAEEYGRPGRIDMEKLLTVRESHDGRAFRAWLQTAGEADFAEFTDRWSSVAGKLVGIHGVLGRGMRWVLSTAAGLAPAGVVIGPTVGALDMFLLERVVPFDGPIAFLKYRYPSVFKRADNDRQQ